MQIFYSESVFYATCYGDSLHFNIGGSSFCKKVHTCKECNFNKLKVQGGYSGYLEKKRKVKQVAIKPFRVVLLFEEDGGET